MNSVDFMQGDSSDQSLPHSQSRPQAPGPPGSKFSIMYFNCRSMLPKFDELVALCSNDKPDVICLVETWLCEDVLDSELPIPNYSILRLDRNRHGDGPAGLELITVSLSRINFKLCI